MKNVTFLIAELDLYFELHFTEVNRNVILVTWGRLAWGLCLGLEEKVEEIL